MTAEIIQVNNMQYDWSQVSLGNPQPIITHFDYPNKEVVVLKADTQS